MPRLSMGMFAQKLWYKSGAKTAWLSWQYRQLRNAWQRLILVASNRAAGSRQEDLVVILPSDPKLLCASKGDEAMLRSLLAAIRADDPNYRVIAAVSGDEGEARSARLGVDFTRITYDMDLQSAFDTLAELRPAKVVWVAADVADGAYDPCFSLRNFALLDLLTRAGATGHVTGFSVSAKPYVPLGSAFDLAAAGIEFLLRDAVSLERFRQLSHAPAKLVGDVAFLLHPASQNAATAPYLEWINKRRLAGRRVIGLNLHAMLFDPWQLGRIGELMAQIAAEIGTLMDEADVDILLIAHDFREDVADHHCLGPLHAHLARFADRVMPLLDEISAAEIKQLAGQLDGVVSGRMHLAIAALGGGVPVLGLAYKGKFAGLFQHFGLGSTSWLDAEHVLEPGVLNAAIAAFLARLPAERAQLALSLPQVKALAALNVAQLLPAQPNAACRATVDMSSYTELVNG